MNLNNTHLSLDLSSNVARPSLMIAHLDSWGTITVTGDDKKTYLQGQLTCNVATLEKDQIVWGAHCDAKGKVWSAFRLFHYRDGYAMLQPKSAIDAELNELKKYAVFSRVSIQCGDDIAFGIMGEHSEAFVNQFSHDRGDVRTLDDGCAIKIDEQRWVLLLSSSAAEQLINTHSTVLVSDAVWRYFDIEAALPIVNESEQNKHIPQALNIHALRGISFTKGCYTGQEVIARAKYRGINKRTMYIVKGNLTAPLPDNEPVQLERAVGKSWRSVGQLLTHYAFANNTAVGLIVLPNDLDEPIELRLSGQADTKWSIQPLPYLLDSE